MLLTVKAEYHVYLLPLICECQFHHLRLQHRWFLKTVRLSALLLTRLLDETLQSTFEGQWKWYMGNRWLSLRDCVLSNFICEGVMLSSIAPNNFSDFAWLIHGTNWELSLLPTFILLVTCKHWAVNKGNSFLLRLNSRPRFSLFAFSFPRLWLPCGLTLLWQVSFDKTRCHTGDSPPFFQSWHCCRSPCWYFRRDAAKIWHLLFPIWMEIPSWWIKSV
jgi:hypothetical protein